MKKANGFWGSLEQYGWKVVGRSPLPYSWVGVVVVAIVIAGSVIGAKTSVVGESNLEGVVEKAARLGDYTTAQKLWNNQLSITNNQLEDLVYPERKVERRIAELETKLEEYPGNRQIYLGLADLYGQLGNEEKSEEYREKARILDPNN